MAKSTAHELAEPTPRPAESACAAADALLRAAVECARQHDRLGRCLEAACSDDEFTHLVELSALTDAHLDAMTTAYEDSANAAPEAKDEAWWKAANAMWLASREYCRRTAGTNRVQRLAGKHSKEKLSELTMEYELERSALMALKQAVTAMKAIRPNVA
jgi:hypothetical protein